VTIAVGVVLVFGVNARGAEPTGTIGLGGVDVLVEFEPDEDLAGGGF
jgi:predicted nucleotidyltransferase